MGHVQDTPVSTSIISIVGMICHMKVHIVSYNLDQKKFSKSKIHTLPNYEQTDLKTAIVTCNKKTISSTNMIFYARSAKEIFASIFLLIKATYVVSHEKVPSK